MITILVTNELPEKPLPEILSEIDGCIAAQRLAAQHRDAAVAAIQKLNGEALVCQVMCLYWKGPHVFRVGELGGFLNLSVGQFLKLAKEWQPCRVEKCFNCRQPAVARLHRAGIPEAGVDDVVHRPVLCEKCARAAQRADCEQQLAERRAFRVRGPIQLLPIAQPAPAKQPTPSSGPVAAFERLIVAYLEKDPQGGTFAKIAAMIDAHIANRDFECAFNRLLQQERLVAVSETPGGTKLYGLAKGEKK